MTSRRLIACFHGGGSNSDVMQVQCARLQKVLDSDFEFRYFNAPFERSPGPGVLPFFEDFAPFRTWFKPDGNELEMSDGSGYDEIGRDGVERVFSIMRSEKDTVPDDWVGVLGFSQGTRVASGLLLDQQCRVVAELLPNDFNLKFGVMCMGGGAPMESEVGHTMKQIRSPNSVSSPLECDIIGIPTIHLHGLKDGNLENGRIQKGKHFDQSSAILYEIDYHHAMPWLQSEIDHLADLIRQVYKASN